MEIKRLTALSGEEFHELGVFGYTSMQKYEAITEETEDAFHLRLSLVQLKAPFIKQELNNDEDIENYRKMVKLGHSLGLYADGRLAALAITEPQTWNNTLMVWHFQVHEGYRRRGFGRQLLGEVVELARRRGFRAVTLETQNTNSAAIRFYRQCGFTIEGIDLSLYANRGTGSEEIALFMRKNTT